MMGEVQSSPWPQRTITHLQDDSTTVDNTVWDDLMPLVREGDIVINTFMKTGTTWMTQVMLQMINNGEETLFFPENIISYAVPWVENFLISPKDATLTKFKATPPDHRRVLKSHLQLDALLFSPKLRYVCVFRDGRDCVMSHHHHLQSKPKESRKPKSRLAEFEDFAVFFENWLNGNKPFWSDYFHHHQSWWKYAHSCDNILVVNYNEMKRDLASVVLRLAKFLDIRVGEPTSPSFQNILRHSSFEYMKQHEDLFEPPPTIMHPGNFIHKGVAGRWREVLSESQHKAYWDKVTECWPPDLIEFVHKDSS